MDKLEVLSAVMLRSADLHGDDAADRLFGDWLTDYQWIFIEDKVDGIPEQFIDIIFRLKKYNAIVNLFSASEPFMGREYPERIVELAKYAQDIASDTQDKSMLACAAKVLSPDEIDAILEEVPCTNANTELFATGPRYREAVSQLLRSDRIKTALRICRFQQDHRLEGEIYESAGDTKASVRAYLEGGAAAEALEVSRRAGYDIGMARAYDRLGRFEEALQIWQRRGNRRDANRMRQKITDSRQRGLFD